MNRIIFLLAVLTFASCSRIVTKDYELLDSGTVAEIDNVEGKIGIASNRDGVCREWFPETMRTKTNRAPNPTSVSCGPFSIHQFHFAVYRYNQTFFPP